MALTTFVCMRVDVEIDGGRFSHRCKEEKEMINGELDLLTLLKSVLSTCPLLDVIYWRNRHETRFT